MKARLCLLAVVLIGVLISIWRSGSSSLAAPSTDAPSRLIGAGGCAAAACHNGYAETGHPRTEYAQWLIRDSHHAQTYDVLLGEKSCRIQMNLHAKFKAHEDPLCLKCHAAPEHEKSLTPYFKRDGISCESCHGPAKHWVGVHFQDDWKSKSPEEKAALGMTDTQSLRGRAQVCAKCHVGQPGMNVDHALIAAGHPRLNFEFAAFHAAMPHHWPDAKDRAPTVIASRGGPDFEARAWLMGQLVTAQVSLDLLASRADENNKVWPEFADYDCAACHHDLKSQSNRQSQAYYGKRKPGALPWGSYVAIIEKLQGLPSFADPALADKLMTIYASFDSGKPDRLTIVRNACAAVKILQKQQEKLTRQHLDDKSIQGLLEKMLEVKYENGSDTTTQAQLGAAALRLASIEMRLELPSSVQNEFRNKARIATSMNSYDPSAIQKRLNTLRTLDSQKAR